MARGRPPVAAAKTEAVARLIAAHTDEFKEYEEDYLAEHGWAKKTVTKQVWTNDSEEGTK